MKKGVRFKKPPLIEALCELRFRKTNVNPNIVLGRFYEKIEQDFPTIETHRGIGVQAEEELPSPTIFMEERTRFISKDETKLIQIGPGLLVINHLKPYNNYLTFKNLIEKTVNIYYEIAKPEELIHLGLRYINKIDMRSDQSLEDTFRIGFIIPSSFKSFPDPYFLRLEFSYCFGRDRLIVILATAHPHEDYSSAAMLDFDYTLVSPEGINGNMFKWMDEAHDNIEEAFHTCLDNSVLASFEPEEN